ncbi:phage tail tape measure protein [Pseudomonas cremoricolorata]|uniref:phage tail tape measure protein n=1 Tax=Pseudomonas cremoricolorata TaxID=157783 RepID=UPI0003FFA3C2|nr:phage tail tape measure protein [Pseudomonas cremoricolorata]
MAGKLALSLVIGGVVSSTVGSALGTVKSGIKQLEQQGNRAKVLKSTIGETIKLRDEWKRAHDTGAAGADKLQSRFERNLKTLRDQGIEVGRLGREYQRLGREAKAVDLQIKGRVQIDDGVKGLKSNAGRAMALTGALAIPTKVSGDYQANIRQMALWAHIAGEGEEQQMADRIAKVAADVGMGQQALATAVGGLIEKGIDWQESVDYAPLIADLIDGQGMEGETIATLFSAFKEAGVKKEDMGAMLGQVAAAGDIGAFGPKDMARYMPSLLGTIKTLGMEGPEAVRFLGASLQSQYKQTQDSAAAATNMNNLLNAVISSTSQERFAKEGIDLAGSIGRAVKTGKAANPVEAYIKLTDVLLKQQNPTKFKEVQALKKRIQESAEGSAEEAQAMASLLQSAGLATIVSDQSASAGLLAQIKYGDVIKDDMATIKDTDGKAKIEGDAGKARDTSNAKWGTVKAGSEAALTKIGDAIRPLTDRAADVIGQIAYKIGELADKAPNVVAGIMGISAALIAVGSAWSTFKIGKGIFDLARGKLLGGIGGKNEIQKVFVTNHAEGGEGGGNGGNGDSRRSRVLGLLQAGLKVFKKDEPAEAGGGDGGEPGEGAPAGDGEDKPAGALGLVDAGLKVLDTFREAKGGEGGDGDGADAGPQKVFVVNVADFRGIGSSVGGRRGSRRQGRRNGGSAGSGRNNGRRRNRGGTGGNDRSTGPRPPRPPRPPAPPPVPPPTRLRRIGSALGAVGGKVSMVGKRLPGGALFDAGMSMMKTAMTAKTREEKVEGYGTAAGGLAGSLAGAAAGAAIGSVVPVIGTAIGGAVGAALGGMGGESLGSWLSKRLFGDDEEEGKSKDKAKPGDGDETAPIEPGTAAKPAAEPAPLTVNPIALPAAAPSARPVIATAPVVNVSNNASVQTLPVPALGQVVREPVPAPVPPALPVIVERSAGQTPVATAPLVAPPLPPVSPARSIAAPAPQVTVNAAAPAAPVVNVTGPSLQRPTAAPQRPLTQVIGKTVPERLAAPTEPSEPAQVRPVVVAQAPEAATDRHARVQLVPALSPAMGDALRDIAQTNARVVPAPRPERAVVVSPVVPIQPVTATPVAQQQVAALPPALGEALRERSKAKIPTPPPARADAAKPATMEQPAVDRAVLDFPPAPPSPLGSVLRSELTRIKPEAPSPVVLRPIAALAAAEPTPVARLPEPTPLVLPERPAQRVDRPPYPAPSTSKTVPNDIGEIVRRMDRPQAQLVKLPEASKPASVPAPKPPKVEQTFTFAPHMPITVQGDVKDSAQIVRDIEAPLRRLFEQFMRESNQRMSSVQLFDAPHV